MKWGGSHYVISSKWKVKVSVHTKHTEAFIKCKSSKPDRWRSAVEAKSRHSAKIIQMIYKLNTIMNQQDTKNTHTKKHISRKMILMAT